MMRPGELGIGMLFERVGEAVIAADPKTQRIVLWNPAAERMFGYSASEALELRVEALVPEHLKTDHRAGIARYAQTGHGPYIDSNEPLELPAVRKDGEEIRIEMSLSPLGPAEGANGNERFVLAIVRDITERKRAEEELSRYAAEVADLYNNAPCGYHSLDKEGTFIAINDTELAWLGYAREEVVGRKKFSDILTEESLRTFRENYPRFKERGSIRDLEFELVRKDGTLMWVLLSATAIKDAAGNFMASRSTFVDITERKRAEEEVRRLNKNLEHRVRERTSQLEAAVAELESSQQALRQSEERFRLLVQNSSDVISVFDAEGTVVYQSPSIERILGHKPEDSIGKNVFESPLVHPDDLARQRYFLAEARENPDVDVTAEFRMRRADGSWRHIEAIGRNLLDDPRIAGIVANYRDITERKRIEDELQRNESRLQAAQRIAHLGSWEYYLDEDAAQWSDELYRIFGFTPQEFVPRYKMFFEHVHPDDRRSVQKEALRALRGEEESQIEYRIVRTDGEVRYVHTEYELVRNGLGKPIKMVGTVQDITERKRAEMELEALVDELRRSNTELEQFAYVASHDLQEPLRMVSSYTQLLARRYKGKLGPDAEEFIGYAVDGARRMHALINDLLQYSRVGTRGRELVPTGMTAVFEAACANLMRAIDESSAEVDSGELPVVMGDDVQLGQLLQNLISNAIKFRKEEAPPEVRVEAERRDGEWLFSVSDNGIGIDPEYRERIFVIFQRLHGRTEYEGTGIGLAVCKKIVERHGGKIWVESEPGEGSTFYFTLRAA